MDRFRPSADVLIAHCVVVEIGEFDRDIMREIWETAIKVPEHLPLLHAPPEHVACCLQMAQIGLKRGQESVERDILLQAEQPMQGRFSRRGHEILLKRMRICCTTLTAIPTHNTNLGQDSARRLWHRRIPASLSEGLSPQPRDGLAVFGSSPQYS